MPEIQGVGHLMLSVTDVQQSAEFYSRLFDAEIIMSAEDAVGPVAICASAAVIFGFRTHSGTRGDDRFDPARVGLDHVGFNVARREELDGWKERLDEQGVVNSGIQQDDFGWHLNAKDPNNIALEFFYAPPQG